MTVTVPNAKDRGLIVPSLEAKELTNVPSIMRNAVGENRAGKVSSKDEGILLDFTQKLISKPRATAPATINPHNLVGFTEK